MTCFESRQLPILWTKPAYLVKWRVKTSHSWALQNQPGLGIPCLMVPVTTMPSSERRSLYPLKSGFLFCLLSFSALRRASHHSELAPSWPPRFGHCLPFAEPVGALAGFEVEPDSSEPV